MILCTLNIIICKYVTNVLEAETKHCMIIIIIIYQMSTWHNRILIYYYVFDVIIVTNRMQTSLWASALDYIIYVIPATLQRMYIVKGYKIKSTVFASTCEFVHINLTCIICCKSGDVNFCILIICTRKYKWWKEIIKSTKKS